MLQDEIMKKLTRVGTVKLFKPQEYICYEGQPGAEMYVILKGVVGVYANSTADSQVEICRMGVGDFFGEMAILDNQPRSASCIALENAVCAAVGKDQLERFLADCPSLAMKVLESLSLRIRRLSNALYKDHAAISSQSTVRFEIPAGYARSHPMEEPPYDPAFLIPVSAPCPICGETVIVHNMKKLLMAPGDLRRDGRTVYRECDPLWHSIWNCPHCGYSNYYSRFFAITSEEKACVQQVLREQHLPTIERRLDLRSPFDLLFIHYLQAIHISLFSGEILLAGRLWRNLYWLFDDAGDPVMKEYCAKHSSDALSRALASNEIPDEESRATVQLSMTDMYHTLGNNAAAAAICNEILSGSDSLQLRKLAHDLKLQFRL